MTFTRHAGALALALLTSCGFAGSPGIDECGPMASRDWITCMLNRAPLRAPDSDARKTVYETPGIIRVRHGRSCTALSRATDGTNIGFRVQDQESVPLSLADSGTVFMNGWELRYTQGDHHVGGLGSAIVNISTRRTGEDLLLEWQAGGLLTDQNGDDPYEWCYTYTVVFWNRSADGFDAAANQTGLPFMQTTPSDPGNDTAKRELHGAGVISSGSGVVLPQGFALMWGDQSDHHVLQLGMNRYTPLNTSSSEIAWTSHTLVKDNDTRRDYYAGELVTILSYTSPKSYHPSQVLRETPSGWIPVNNTVQMEPLSSASGCIEAGAPTAESNYKILNVPYQYAVPMLAGWELGYLCTDHHVREIGASIKDFRFEREPFSDTGTLFYTLSMRLRDDSGNLNYAGARVEVLGMNARGPAPHPLIVPSTQPASPPPPRGCTFANMSLASGQSITAYRSPRSQLCEPCESQTRTCNDGVLSGSFPAASCTLYLPSRGQSCP